MTTLKHWRAVLVLAALLTWTESAPGQAFFKLPSIGGAVMAADNQTLIVSLTSNGMLAYYDTLRDKEMRKVEVDFQPGALATQGSLLFATTRGSGVLHVLDVSTGKEMGQIRVPGEPLQALACHPKKGLLYVVNLANEIYAIDPEKGVAAKTKAKGQLLAVDAVDGKYLYTGIQKPMRDQIVIQQSGKTLRISFATANLRAIMLKYEIKGTDLKLVAANDNAAVNGRGMGLSPDGKRIAMAGGGGWRSKTDPKANYSIAVFDTADMQTLLGQVDTGPYPSTIAFHPVLNLGAAYNMSEVIVFNAKSLAQKSSSKISRGAQTALLTFGGKGTKIVFASIALPRPEGSDLAFIPLELSEQDQQTLRKAFP
jgi:DNA-binding beta-propeller fold protein YncE